MGAMGGGKCPFHELGSPQMGAWAAVLAAVVIGAVVAGCFFRGMRIQPHSKGKKRAVESPANDDGGLDAIIVGAGVAGSALAHTLGKVAHSFFLSFTTMS